MGKISRRQLLQRASAGAAFATLGTNASYSVALPPREVSSSLKPSFEWIRSVRLMIAEGLKVVAYNPLNHPFMDVRAANPLYRDWMRYDAVGRPYVTRHMGWTTFNEGCVNSPLREEIQKRVREVVTQYPVDLMYFDGPYQGMDQRQRYCHCQYCQSAYQKARGKSIPLQNAATTWEDDFEYQQWLTQDVVENFMQEICEMVRQVRDVPIVYNDTGLLGGDWRSRAYRYVDGFMFEAADTPEEKLFNLRIGQSTGKVIWTYISSHTEYNREHMKDKTVRGWYSAAVEGERLQLDAAVATTAGAGYCYWGLNRLFYKPQEVLDGPFVGGLKSVFEFALKHEALLRSVAPQPLANTGNIWKKLLVQESFLPIENVRARLRLPQGRTAKLASLLWSGVAPSWNVRNGWVELSILQVHPYEVVCVDLHP